ncbi:DUF4129 domain-containing protein [Natrarchaeobius halalkaliphilus]|uniref:DUF4129 domain-containing protein n=1 Tax=Natrarchaeobius halalkaliphilus TaxID=1679091 RepID=A0A3N6LUE0_9EURY|nr:DUF4129 domain-containing protein [Natrarchaeobius halalkaliphilus]RQG91184.1 DUF4129 domain-containing protein [Natrarchaeobius halalkaliphilus]
MSRTRGAVRIVVALVGIAAIAMAAATIRSPTEPDGSGGVGEGDSGSPTGVPQHEPTDPAPLEVPAIVEYLAYALLILLALGAAWYLISHRRDLVKLIAVVLVVSLVLAGISYLLLRLDLWESVPLQESEPETNDSLGGEPGEGDDQQRQPFSTGPVLVVLAVLTAIFVGSLLRSDRDGRTKRNESEPGDGPSDASDSDRAEVGAAAGRAADRIESSDDFDNEVYRAWLEMTRPLEVDRPASSTPGEFATVAVDAGVRPEHVDELTSLFEEVRYGNRETTDDVESRAISVLRRIEDEYAEPTVSDVDGRDAIDPTKRDQDRSGVTK